MCKVVLVTWWLLVCVVASKDRKSELLDKQQSVSNGVLHFTPSHFDYFASGKPRSYSLIIMLKADHLMDKSNLQLSSVLEEFELTSKAYMEKFASGAKAGKVFFGTLEYKESAHIFERLGVNALPLIIRVPGQMTIKKTGDILISAEDKMTPQTYQQYPWSAETIAEFVQAQTGLKIDRIPRYSIFQSVFFIPSVIGCLIALSFGSYKLYQSSILHSQWIYIILSMAVCWFATSGGLFNIIRGIPFVVHKRDGTVQFFYPGATQQLGAEGFIMGSGYIVFSTVFLLSTYVLPTIPSPSVRRLSFYALVAVASLCLKEIMAMYYAKTGYSLQQYIL